MWQSVQSGLLGNVAKRAIGHLLAGVASVRSVLWYSLKTNKSVDPIDIALKDSTALAAVGKQINKRKNADIIVNFIIKVNHSVTALSLSAGVLPATVSASALWRRVKNLVGAIRTCYAATIVTSYALVWTRLVTKVAHDISGCLLVRGRALLVLLGMPAAGREQKRWQSSGLHRWLLMRLLLRLLLSADHSQDDGAGPRGTRARALLTNRPVDLAFDGEFGQRHRDHTAQQASSFLPDIYGAVTRRKSLSDRRVDLAKQRRFEDGDALLSWVA
jgi:hypothetical protein